MMEKHYIINKVTLKVISSIITQLQADTLFGSICWAYYYMEGEEKLKNFLKAYNDSPPLIVSDGFPEEWLPKPILKPLTLEQCEKMTEEVLLQKKSLNPKDEDLDFLKLLMQLKDLKRLNYIPQAYFLENQNCFSAATIAKDYLLGKLDRAEKMQPKDEVILHSAINRMTGRAREAALFSTTETFYSPGSKITIYLKIHKDWIDKLPLFNIFKFIEVSGFGKKKSAGKGQVEIQGEIEGLDSFYPIDAPNAFMTLSSFVPRGDDPTEGYYQPILKYGKLGGNYAKSRIEKNNGFNPFKRPIIMFASGSVFYIKEKDENHKPIIRDYYGGLINNIHWSESIKHYGIAFPLGLKLDSY